MLEQWFMPIVQWLGLSSFTTLLLLIIVILLIIKAFRD